MNRSTIAAFLGVGALTVGQPLADCLGRFPEFVLAHGLVGRDLALVAAIALLGPGLLAGGAYWLARKLRVPAQIALVGTLGALVGLGVIAALPSFPGRSGIGVLTGIAVAILYRRTRWTPTFLASLVLAIPVWAAVLAWSPSGSALRPGPGSVHGEGAAPIPVVVVVFDELSSAALLTPELDWDPAVAPNFARLAARATWYRNATSPAPDTIPALTSLLGGRLPTATPPPGTLFDLVRGSHRFVVEEPRTWFSRRPPRSWRALSRDLTILYAHRISPVAAWLPPIDQDWRDFGRGGPTRVQRFEQWMRADWAGDRAPLLFLHTLFPHAPYTHRADGRLYGLGAREPFLTQGGWPGDPAAAGEALARYCEQVRWTDRMLGRILDRLEAEGLFDDALVVVVADHGSGFVPGGKHRVVDATNGCAIRSVPLLVKLPGQRIGAVDDGPAGLPDVLPTVCEVLGLQIPWTVDGERLPARGSGSAADAPVGCLPEVIRSRRPEAEPLFGVRVGLGPGEAEACPDYLRVSVRFEGEPDRFVVAVDDTVRGRLWHFAEGDARWTVAGLISEVPKAGGSARWGVFAVDAGGSLVPVPIEGRSP